MTQYAGNFRSRQTCRTSIAIYPESLPDERDFRPGATGAGTIMKVRASVKRICEKCKLIRRKGVVRIICEDPRHKQRQG